ncbi:MAG TPA: 2,3-bisphosphoglycerate-independent phosphoglycerate mutase [Vicinamibacterales bacterium]|nr:2,3-bisphosphoglycerate-independent phosphoglycerate mutase [Vicinamibacterales bacterium]
MKPPLVLLILDGWGVSHERDHNAIALARTPNYLELLSRYPSSTLIASGTRVGLPRDQMGNSEVGHTNMGAGRVVYQDLTRIDKAIEDGEFQQNPVLRTALSKVAGTASALHLIGLVSDGGVHSHIDHAIALLRMARSAGVGRIFVHVITDGRDTSPRSGVEFVGRLRKAMDDTGAGQIATVSGRYFAMDRDRRWDRTKLAYDAITRAEGPRHRDAIAFLTECYARDVTDEFVPPTVIGEGAPVRDGDAVVCFNFRADRVRQMTAALTQPAFDGFARALPDIHYTCLTEYDARFNLPVAFAPQVFREHLGEVLGRSGLANLRLAETEKYAHVTYFFNCGEEQPYPREDRLLIPSPKVATYDLAPAMSAEGITSALVEDLDSGRHDVIICNFANADMVGHTGSLEATIRAVETLDACLGRAIAAVRRRGGVALLTADHGNCEQMWDAERQLPHTAHTSNPVPVVLIKDDFRSRVREGGALCDVAPTILRLLGLPQPPEMTGVSLIDE